MDSNNRQIGRYHTTGLETCPGQVAQARRPTTVFLAVAFVAGAVVVARATLAG